MTKLRNFDTSGLNIQNVMKSPESMGTGKMRNKRVDYGFNINGMPNFVQDKTLGDNDKHTNSRYSTQINYIHIIRRGLLEVITIRHSLLFIYITPFFDKTKFMYSTSTSTTKSLIMFPLEKYSNHTRHYTSLSSIACPITAPP